MRRSMLFLPGNTPNMLINGNCLGSDAVIFDLEDAVSPAEKDAARILVHNTMRYMDFRGCEIIVRINYIDTPYWKKDLDEILPWDFIDAGVTKDFLKREYARAKEGLVTPNCRQGCSGCGCRKYDGGVCYEA
jgi:hypothetical protein